MRLGIGFLVSGLAAMMMIGGFLFGQSLQFNRVALQNPTMLVGSLTTCQDQKGLLWIGGHRRIYQYDGYDATSYVSSEWVKVHHIVEDRLPSGTILWLSGLRGFRYFDLTTRRLISIPLVVDAKGSSHSFTAPVLPPASSSVWIAHGQTIFCYDKVSGDSQAWPLEESDHALQEEGITRLLPHQDSNLLWVLCSYRLFTFDKRNGQLKSCPFTPFISLIMRQLDGRMAILDRQNKLYLAATDTSDFVMQLPLLPDPTLGANHWVEAGDGRFFLGTDQGLYVFDRSYRLQAHHGGERETGLAATVIKHLYIDKRQRLWVCNVKGELFSADLQPRYFHRNLLEGLSRSPFPSPKTASCFLRDGRGWLWLGTHRHGLHVQTSEGWHHIEGLADQGRQLALEDISALAEDREGNIWIGGYSWGSARIEANSLSKKALTSPTLRVPFQRFFPQALSPRRSRGWSVRSFSLDSHGRIWISHIDGGMDCFISGQGLARHYAPMASRPNWLPSSRIWTVVEGKGDWQGYYFVVTDQQGIFALHEASQRFDPLTLRSTDGRKQLLDTRSFYQVGGSNQFWVAASQGGIASFSLEQDRQGRPQVEGVLFLDVSSQEDAFGILPGSPGKVWTRIGEELFEIDLHTRQAVKQYSGGAPREGFFFMKAQYRDPLTGKLFYGQTNGYLSFHPDSVGFAQTSAQLLLTDLFINHQRVAQGHGADAPFRLDRPIHDLDTLVLPHSYRSFSLAFTTVEFFSSLKRNYRYRLVGHDTAWYQLPSGNQTLTYTHLPVGSYELHLTVAQAKQDLTSATHTLHIVVKPRFYQTIWFLGLVGLTLIASVFLLLRLRTRMLKQSNQALSRKIEAHTKARTRFYNNISHELRTPLTLITMPLEAILSRRSLSHDLARDLSSVHQNAWRMRNILDQLLEIGRIEEGYLSLQEEPIDLISLLHQVKEAFDGYARQKEIELEIIHDPPELIILTDKDKWEKILYNLFSNAIKYTQPQGRIRAQVTQRSKWVEVRILDNGPGISPEKLADIFDRYPPPDGAIPRIGP